MRTFSTPLQKGKHIFELHSLIVFFHTVLAELLVRRRVVGSLFLGPLSFGISYHFLIHRSFFLPPVAHYLAYLDLILDHVHHKPIPDVPQLLGHVDDFIYAVLIPVC